MHHLVSTSHLTAINIRAQPAAGVYELTAGPAPAEICRPLAAGEPLLTAFLFSAANVDRSAAFSFLTFLDHEYSQCMMIEYSLN